MRLVTYCGEESITVLILKLYQIPRHHKSALKKAEEHVRRANPHLNYADFARTRFGSLIVVPDISEIEHRKKTAPVRHGGQALLVQMRLVLTSVSIAASVSVDNEVKRARQTLNRFNTDKVKALARKNVEIRERVTVLAEMAEEKIKLAVPMKTAHQHAFEKLSQKLDGYIKRFSRLER